MAEANEFEPEYSVGKQILRFAQDDNDCAQDDTVL
jgi:hypothetical protein